MTRIRGRLQRLERRFGKVRKIGPGQLLPFPELLRAMNSLDSDLLDRWASDEATEEEVQLVMKGIREWFEAHGYSFPPGYWDD